MAIKYFVFECTWWRLFWNVSYALNLISIRFYYYHWVDTSDGGLLVLKGIICPVVGVRVAQWVRSLDLTTHTSLSPIRRGFAPGFLNYKKGCTRLAAACDVYQLLSHGRWFSPASSTTKTGRHDIAEILLKVALTSKIKIKSNQSVQ